MKNNPNKMDIKNILSHAREFNKTRKAFKLIKKKVNKRLKNEIYRNILKRKQNKINNELKKLKLHKLANIDNISQRDLVNIKKYNAHSLKTLQQIAKLRNININMSKKDTIYALICSEPVINEEKYISYLNNGSNNDIDSKINEISMHLFEVSPYMNKRALKDIKKRLHAIKILHKITRSKKNKLLQELNSFSVDLKFERKKMISDYRDDNYANIDDIEYMFDDIDNYYQPILTSSLFNSGYQGYHFRGDPNRNMSVTTYFDKIIPYLRVLIDGNKLYEQKIQLDMGINMVHISEQRRITHFSKSGNVICLPSSDTNEIINQLLTSLYEKYEQDLTISHASSSFSYESVEELNIHFNKIDLRRGASFIETPKWLKSKKGHYKS